MGISATIDFLLCKQSQMKEKDVEVG